MIGAVHVSCVLFVLVVLVCSSVGEKDLKDLDKEVSRCCKAKQTFDRLVLTKEEALDMFDYNSFKKWAMLVFVTDY